MKIIVQRVKKAKVEVNGKNVGEINQGYLLYICFEVNDKRDVIDKAIKKIVNLRIFEDSNKKMNHSIKEVSGSILSISQFTLSWCGRKGNRPSFDQSMPPEEASIFFRVFNDNLKKHVNLEEGIFSAEMQVTSVNDGPCTFMFNF